jgi:cysteinyl-tRNA synthetase
VFSYESLDQASATYKKLLRRIDNLKDNGDVDASYVSANRDKFIKAVGSDMNTALGITAIYDILKAQVSDATKLACLKDIDTVLSINLVREKVEEAPVEAVNDAPKSEFELEIEALIVERKEAKKAKNFVRADEIRNYLKEKGVTLIDTPQGTTYTIS